MAGNIRNQALQYLPGLVEEGLSNTEITRTLRDLGLSYRTQAMYADINQFRLEQIGADYIKGLDRDAPIPERYMRTWVGDVAHEYRVVVKFEYLDKESGAVLTDGTTLYFDHNPSQSEVLDYFETRKGTLESGTGTNVNIEEVYGATKIQYFRNVPRPNAEAPGI